jgi:hypothetical protein
MDISIRYGLLNSNIDITNICIAKLLDNGIITIHPGDQWRSSYFTDPIVGTLKEIIVITSIYFIFNIATN